MPSYDIYDNDECDQCHKDNVRTYGIGGPSHADCDVMSFCKSCLVGGGAPDALDMHLMRGSIKPKEEYGKLAQSIILRTQSRNLQIENLHLIEERDGLLQEREALRKRVAELENKSQ